MIINFLTFISIIVTLCLIAIGIGTCIVWITHRAFKKIKVDKSRTNAQLYAVYTRKHCWNKWIQESTYADYDLACVHAEKIARKKTPVYY